MKHELKNHVNEIPYMTIDLKTLRPIVSTSSLRPYNKYAPPLSSLVLHFNVVTNSSDCNYTIEAEVSIEKTVNLNEVFKNDLNIELRMAKIECCSNEKSDQELGQLIANTLQSFVRRRVLTWTHHVFENLLDQASDELVTQHFLLWCALKNEDTVKSDERGLYFTFNYASQLEKSMQGETPKIG